MFRNSRGDADTSLGRPPTPPQRTPTATRTPSATASCTPMPTNIPARPMKGTQKPTTKNSPAREKDVRSGNASILSFFKKETPKAREADSLFLSDNEEENGSARANTAVENLPVEDRDEENRYNESAIASKRRRTDSPGGNRSFAAPSSVVGLGAPADTVLHEIDVSNSQEPSYEQMRWQKPGCEDEDSDGTTNPSHTIPPSLPQEATSGFDDGFEGIEDFIDDEFPENGEETMERRWMEEQRRLELDFEQDDDLPAAAECEAEPGDTAAQNMHAPIAACPICSASLEGVSADEASQHVNACLDGTNAAAPPSAAPCDEARTASEANQPVPKPPPYKRFQRAAIARPGQENPFSLDSSAKGGSAFSKLMASHAEDNAWATAAANEVAARGQPAYKRTCPFYKILPGFFICVDAFRYGAVEGCHAYFLSHFHSDHYVGLTSSWSHGPIYCSRVTGNLVRQQLRVDPQWVVDLEWDVKIEVPRTQGVHVTMIPANHCPGSSLFLFEKTIGRGPKPKQQRVLHCGDFRACPAHVQHPLLRPDLRDAVTGKTREQKLDVCYLDTTYLTPKYAFPRQDEVIKACADMCVSLSKEHVDTNDDYEQMKKQRAGIGMARFIQKDGSSSDAPASTDPSNPSDPPGQIRHAASSTASRGRLLVVVGTYSIGKERICIGIAQALGSKIYAPPGKQKICAALQDPLLSSLLTTDPHAAQVHMQMLMEIRAETLADYLTSFAPHFSRIVGFRPSGWNYRPPAGRFVESPLVSTVLHSDNWRPHFTLQELVPQRGSSRQAACYGVPYSEHSSFRELSMFCCALRIDKIVPTVNVGSAKSREKMMAWVEKWSQYKRKNGLYAVAEEAVHW